jgi:hypothetical protein
MKGEIVPESAVRFVRNFDAPAARAQRPLSQERQAVRRGNNKAQSLTHIKHRNELESSNAASSCFPQ